MSLEAQIHEMREFAERQGWTIVTTYELAETRSTDLEKAPEYQRMLADAKTKQWQVLLCHKLDRLGRDRDMVVMFKASLRRRGIEIKSVVENLSDSIEHRMLEQIHEVFADYYAKNLGQETRKGHKQLVRQGFWKGGKPAWGLQVVEVEVTGANRPRKKLAACPVRGPLMVQVFERLIAGEPPELIRRWVANRTNESEWSPASFYDRIHNPVYYGRLEYGRTTLPPGRQRKRGAAEDMVTGRWEGLISEELWRAANAMVDGKRRRYVRPTADKQPTSGWGSYLLTELVTCRECKGPMVGSRANGHRKYRCNNRKCSNASVRAEKLERAVLQAIGGVVSEQSNVAEVLSALLQPASPPNSAQESALRKQLDETRLRQRRLLAAIEQGLEPEDIGARVRELKASETEIVDALSCCQIEARTEAAVTVVELQALWEGLESMPLGGEDADDLRTILQYGFTLEVCPGRAEGCLAPRALSLTHNGGGIADTGKLQKANSPRVIA